MHEVAPIPPEAYRESQKRDKLDKLILELFQEKHLGRNSIWIRLKALGYEHVSAHYVDWILREYPPLPPSKKKYPTLADIDPIVYQQVVGFLTAEEPKSIYWIHSFTGLPFTDIRAIRDAEGIKSRQKGGKVKK